MRTWIDLLFGNKKTKAPARPTTRSASRLPDDNPATVEDDSENGMRRQLVHVLLRDALRRNGIPADWIDCRMLVVSSRSRGSGMYVRLVVRHWDERLMRYLFALEKTLITDIERFEPRATTWLHGISWQIEPVNDCPYPTLPEKSFWQADSSARASQFGDIASRPAPLESRSRPASLEVLPGDTRSNAARAAEMAAAVRQANAARRAYPAPPGPGERPHFASTVPYMASQFAPASAPFSSTVPDGAFEFEPAASKTTTPPADGTANDLAQLFAIRDRELGLQGENSGLGNFEKTEPTPLNVLKS